MTWPMCVSLCGLEEWRRAKKEGKKRKSQLSLLMTICQSSSFPAPPLSSRCLLPQLLDSYRTSLTGTSNFCSLQGDSFYLPVLAFSFFFFEAVSVYARASLPIYSCFFYLSHGGKVNTEVGADVPRIKACDDFEVCLLWSVISAPQCSPCHECLSMNNNNNNNDHNQEEESIDTRRVSFLNHSHNKSIYPAMTYHNPNLG